MTDLRTRKKAALRDVIVRTAVELFAERGYDAVSVEEITRVAMCSRSTFNRYFGTKEDVLFPGAAQATDNLRRALERADTSADPWVVARTHVREQLTIFVEGVEPKLRERCFQLWFREGPPHRRYLEMASQWEQTLVAFFLEHTDRDADARMRCHLLATTLVAALRTALHATIELRLPADMATARVFGLLEAGLGGDTLK